MRNYWSCGKFADKIRGTMKPKAATGKGWDNWHEQAKAAYPIRYWIVEEGFDAVQTFINWPADRFHDVRYYINNRWITKSHALTAHPSNIKPGSWCDVGNRFLPCLFNELVDFVEVEQAWHHVIWDEEARKKFNVPLSRRWFKFRTWRSPEAGLAYLDWAGGLTMGESWGVEPDSEDYGKPTHQALAAQEIKALYTWWKEVYLNRPDVYEATGWTDYCSNLRTRGSMFSALEDNEPTTRKRTDDMLDQIREIEKAYEEEDEAMMIRLIKIRDTLWT